MKLCFLGTGTAGSKLMPEGTVPEGKRRCCSMWIDGDVVVDLSMQSFDFATKLGLDTSRVVPHDPEIPDKTAGHGITTLKDLVSDEEVWPVMLELAQDVGHRLFTYRKRATGVSIFIRDNCLSTRQWQCRLPYPTQSPHRIAREAYELFCRSYEWKHPIRSVTVRAIGLVPEDTPYQTDLFSDVGKVIRQERLDAAVEALRARYGDHIIRHAVLLHNPKMPGGDVLKRKAAPRGFVSSP